LQLAYPDRDCEKRILAAYDRPGGGHSRSAAIEPLADDLITRSREQAAAIHVADSIYDYATRIASASRTHHQISLGVSPRGILALMRCARVEAALRGGEFVTPDDVKTVAGPVMAHRLILNPEAVLEGIRPDDLSVAILDSVEIPRTGTIPG